MTDEVKAAVADVKSDVAAVAAEPAKIEAKAETEVKAVEADATTWVAKHPNVTMVIAVVVGLAMVYAIFHVL